MGTYTVREIRSRGEWNGLVVSLPNHDVRQGYEWGEVRTTQGWTPRRLAVFNDGACMAAVSILVKRLPLLGWSVLYAPGGPLLADDAPTSAWDTLLEGLHRTAAETRAIFLRLSPKVPNEQGVWRAALVARGFQPLDEDWTIWNTPRVGMTMDLGEPEAELQRRLRKRFREYIASAAKRGVTVRPAVSVEEVRQFHTSLAVVGRRKGLPVRGRPYFERLWSEFLRPGRGVLLVAEHQGEIVGGLLGVRLGSKATMLYVSVRDHAVGLKLNQGPLLYWEFVRWAKAAGCEMIDWGGTGTHFPPREDDPGFGVYHFKLGFNSKLEYLTGYYDLIFRPRLYASFRTLEIWGSAIAWTVRSRFNARFSSVRDWLRVWVRKARQLRISLGLRGVRETLYWAAFGFLRPNRFVILARDLRADGRIPTPRDGVTLEVWDAGQLQAWRAGCADLPPEYYQDRIGGVDVCAVARVGEEVAGLIWIYGPEDASRLFQLRVAEAELNAGFVLPQYRKQGLFKDILDVACLWLKERGCRTAYAGVHDRNTPSLKAFRGAGFRDIGSVRHFLVFRPKVSRSVAPADDAAPGAERVAERA